GTVGMQDDDESEPYAAPDREPSLEGRDQGPRGQAPDLDRTRRARQPVSRRRAVGVRIPRVAAVFDAEQVSKALARAPVVQGDGPRGLERDLDPMVDERAPLYEGALGRRSPTAWRRPAHRHAGGAQTQPRDDRGPKRDLHLVHLV